MTTQQSHGDGTVSGDEVAWLAMRAAGGFAMVMTAACHVRSDGQGFPGQLGIFDDSLLPGLTRLADEIRRSGAVSSVQLHHAGIRAPSDLVNRIVGPSDDAETGAVGLTTDEVEHLRDAFVEGARRAARAGFDGVEIHGAHGYILSAFLSSTLNRRTDRYGGDAKGRARLLREVVSGIRAVCPQDFQLGLRLSPERFGQDIGEIRALASALVDEAQIDYLDMSLWNVFKPPEDETYADRRLLDLFADLAGGSVKIGAAGKITDGQTVRHVLTAGYDFVTLGKAAILVHDFPYKMKADENYSMPLLPVSREELAREGIGPAFASYLSTFPNFTTK